jgi:hypothetical protein
LLIIVIKNPAASIKKLYTLTAIFLVYLLAGCDIDGSNNIPRVPDTGLFIYAEANQHESEDSAQVAAGVYRDGEPVGLIGGDIFEARTATQRVLLKDSGNYSGSYGSLLPVDSSVQEVFFNVVHEPIEAREDRWYPVDIAYIDPGPGELVGKSATVSFPPEVTITGPAAASVYTSINDVIDLSWVAIGEGDTMKLLSAVSCSDGLAKTSYGTVVELADDDGLEAIGLDKLIFDSETNTIVNFIKDASLVMLQELLNELSANNIDPDFLVKKVEANPISSSCEIRLFLQRQRTGQFDVTFDDGVVLGSRSAEVIINYIPPALDL